MFLDILNGSKPPPNPCEHGKTDFHLKVGKLVRLLERQVGRCRIIRMRGLAEPPQASWEEETKAKLLHKHSQAQMQEKKLRKLMNLLLKRLRGKGFRSDPMSANPLSKNLNLKTSQNLLM